MRYQQWHKAAATRQGHQIRCDHIETCNLRVADTSPTLSFLTRPSRGGQVVKTMVGPVLCLKHPQGLRSGVVKNGGVTVDVSAEVVWGVMRWDGGGMRLWLGRGRAVVECKGQRAILGRSHASGHRVVREGPPRGDTL